MPLYFKVGTYCIGIQDDRVEVSIGISICSGTCILQGIESEHTLKFLKVEYGKHESEHIFCTDLNQNILTIPEMLNMTNMKQSLYSDSERD